MLLIFRTYLFIPLLLLFATGTASAVQLWPLEKGMRWEYDKRDSSSTPHEWTSREEVIDKATDGTHGYFGRGVWNGLPGSKFRLRPYIRSTDNEVYSTDGTDEFLEFQIAPVGTIWSYPGYCRGEPSQRITEIVGIETVTVPAGTFDNAYVHRKHCDFDDPILPDSPLRYLYVVPGVGVVKRVHHWPRDPYYAAPTISELTALPYIPKNDLVVDFHPYGTYAYQNGSSWLKLHDMSPDWIITGDLDGNGIDDVIMPFAGHGTFIYQNGSTWKKLHPQSADYTSTTGDLDGNGRDDLILSFPGHGIYVYYNDSFWRRVHSSNPGSEPMVTGDLDGNGKDEVIVDFDAGGISIYYNNSTKVALHGMDPDCLVVGDFDGTAHDDLAVGFPGYGLFVYNNNSTWKRIHSLNPDGGAAGDLDGSGKDDLIMVFETYGTYVYYNDSGWTKIHGISPEGMAIGDLDGSGRDDLILSFDTYGMYVYYNDSGWTRLISHSADDGDRGLATGDLD